MIGLLGLIPGKGKIVMMLALAVVVTAAVGYHFYKVNSLNSRLITAVADLTQSKANQMILEGAIDDLKQSQALLKRQRQVDQVKMDKLGKEYRKSRRKVGELRKILSKHDLGHLMLEKPGLIENIINRGTRNVGKDFEELTDPDAIVFIPEPPVLIEEVTPDE